MLNPWVLLIGVAIYAASCGMAFFKGESIQQTADIAASAKELQTAVTNANTQAALDYKTQLASELEKQKNALSHQVHTRKVYVALAADPAASTCSLAPASLGVLVDSLRASNGAQDAPASGGNAGVQPGHDADKRDAGGSSASPGQHGLDALSVPAQPRGAVGLGR